MGRWKALLGLRGQLAASQTYGGHVLPLSVNFADKHEFIHMHLMLALECVPPFSRDYAGGECILITFRFHDCQVRNVRPTLRRVQHGFPKLIVQFPHPVGGTLYLDEDRRRGWKKRLDIPQLDIKRDDAAAGFSQKLQSLSLSASEFARRQDREVSCKVRPFKNAEAG